jgi:hypothetical protein
MRWYAIRAQQYAAIRALKARVGIGEMLSDIAQSQRPEQGISHRVQQHVGIRMTQQTY